MLSVFGKPLQSSKLFYRRTSFILKLFKYDKIHKFVVMSSGGAAGGNPGNPEFVVPQRTVTFGQQPGGYQQNDHSRRNEKRDRSGSRSRSGSRDKNQSGGSREHRGGFDGHGRGRDQQGGFDGHSTGGGRGHHGGRFQQDQQSYSFGRGRGGGGHQQYPQGQDWNSGGNWKGQGQQGGYNKGGYRNQGQQYSRNNSGEWSESDYTFLSRTLSSILRHNAEKFGFKLMKGGFLYVDEILHKVQKLHGFTLRDVQKVVAENDKKRFSVEEEADGRWKIRANQGHSLEVECLDLRPIMSADEYPTVIHGTYFEAWEKIKHTGLRKMKRNHIHFAAGEPGNTGVISGMRSSCEVTIRIDMAKALADGLKFFVSANNVILSEGNEDGVILPCYFEGAMDRKRRCRLEVDYSIGKTSESEPKKKKKKSKKSKQQNETVDDSLEDDDFVIPGQTSDTSPKKQREDATKSIDTKVTQETVGVSKPEVEVKDVSERLETEKANSNCSQVADAVQTEKASGNCSEVADAVQRSIVDKDYGNEEMESSDTETKDNWEDCVEDTEEILEWNVPKFVKAAKSVAIVEELLAGPPTTVAVCCVGEKIGTTEGHIRAIVVVVYPHVYVYHLSEDNETLVKNGKLDTLLLDKNITKVFINIGMVSRALIHEYDVLMNGVPIWDIELMYKMVKLANMDLETLNEKYGFDGKFKNWHSDNETCGSKLANPDIDQDSLEKITTQGKCITELYRMCAEKMNDDSRRKLKKETFKAAIPDDNDELSEKVKELKLLTSKKPKTANKDADTQQQQQQGGSGKKQGGSNKGGGGGGNKGGKKKGNKR